MRGENANKGPSSEGAIVSLSDVSKTYRMGPNTVEALKDVSLDIMPGEFTAVIGPSGSGKSTLLHILGLLDKPTGGRAVFGGEEVERMSSRRRARARNEAVGFVFQSFYLLPRLNAVDNVMLPLLYGGATRRNARETAREALETVGLGDRARHKPGELSGGESQRVAIARALVNRPRLVLADEPTGNLDRATGSRILDLFEMPWSDTGSAIVVVTHDPEVAERCRRVVRIEDGRIESERAAASA